VTLFYPDVSNNNWSSDADAQDFVAQLVPQGFAGVVHKFSEGNYYEDPYGPVVQAAAATAGLPFLGYHYVTEDDPSEQAQTWLDAGGGNVCMFDWEANGGDLSNYFAVASTFEAAGITVQVGYCPNWYWSEVGGGDLSSIPTLISSAYPAGSDADYASVLYYDDCGGDSGEGWDSYGDADLTCWQFTDNATIAPFTGIDCNAYKGTDLAAAFGITTPAPTPTPTPQKDDTSV
jgi:hypothetical protein